MTLTLLVDLDETLLKIKSGDFVSVYLKAIARFMAPYTPPDRLIHTLLDATQVMRKNNRPDQTLSQVFDAAFFPALKRERAELMPLFDEFYSSEYPKLQEVTQPHPQAVAVIEQAFARGYRVAVATNPLFPRNALLQRLAWAGLPVENHPIELVTSYEDFHFAKPDPAYFAEILAQMGWPEGPIVMVGNDLENDIRPAADLGLYTYHLIEDGSQPVGKIYPHAQGTLAELPAWLAELDPNSGPMDLNTSFALTAILKSTPAALQTMTSLLSPHDWHLHPQSGEWGLTEICCHLRDVEKEVNVPRLEKVLREDNPFIPGMVTDPWAQERHYASQDGNLALRDFTSCRMWLLEMLDKLPISGWQRPARHAIFGPTTIRELLGFSTAHDRTHLQQVYRVIKAMNNLGE